MSLKSKCCAAEVPDKTHTMACCHESAQTQSHKSNSDNSQHTTQTGCVPAIRAASESGHSPDARLAADPWVSLAIVLECTDEQTAARYSLAHSLLVVGELSTLFFVHVFPWSKALIRRGYCTVLCFPFLPPRRHDPLRQAINSMISYLHSTQLLVFMMD